MFRKVLEPNTQTTVAFEPRVKIGLLAVLVVSVLITNVKELAGMLLFGVDPALEEVSRHETRLAPLRKALPQRGVVGFATDAPTRFEMGQRYQMTRYALAPLIVVPGWDHPLVVGDFTGAIAAKHASPGQFTVRQDFGDGLFLLSEPER
jgi:hypothetical protein